MMKNVCKNIYTLIRECVKLLFSRQEFFVGFPKKFLNCVISMLRMPGQNKKGLYCLLCTHGLVQ